MILDNRTKWSTPELEAIVLAALAEFDVPHARERVHVVYGRSFSGFCYFPWTNVAAMRGRRFRRGHAGARMVLRVPRPNVGPFDVAQFVWLVRHEVGHWRGLRHSQMHPVMRHRSLWEKDGRSLPPWAADARAPGYVVRDEAPAKSKARVTDDERAKRLEHARAMLVRAQRRAKLAATIEKRWARRLSYAERAIDKAASRGRS